MNENEELPADHFWDSEEAEREYYAVGQAIAEAEQRVKQVAVRFLCEFILACYFGWSYSGGRPHVVHDSIYTDYSLHRPLRTSFQELFSRGKEDALIDWVQLPLNPYWICQDGRIHYTVPNEKVEELGRNLTLCDAKTETVKSYLYYSYHDKNGVFKQKRLDYSYLKRVEWYSLTGEAAVSGVEYALRQESWLRYPSEDFPMRPTLSDMPILPADVKEAAHALFLNRREEEKLISKVHEFVTPLYNRTRWKFVPYLAPTNVEELKQHLFDRFEERWKSPPTLTYPNLANERPPEIGQRWNTPWWMECGEWARYTFPEAALKSWLLPLENRLHNQVIAPLKEYWQVMEELEPLRRQEKAIRILHYKSAAYKEFWTVLPSTPSLPASSV